MNRTIRGVATAVVLALGLAGCGTAPPTATDKAAHGKSEGAKALEKVYAELEGLTGEKRLKRLVELAAKEKGSLSLYTSTNVDESGPITEEFSDKYGIDVDLYRASSSDVLQRLLQEAQTSYAGADVVAVNGPEMQILDHEKLLLPLETPTKGDLVKAAQYPNWAGMYLNVFVAAWNTKLVKSPPQSWEEVLSGDVGSGKLAMELGDWDWFATLVTQYFMAEKGMSEDEAVELFRNAARKSVVVDGHTTMAELLAAGEFSMVTSAYQHRIPRLRAEGAPVAWEAPVEPIIVRPNGIGIYRDTDRPASALLFVEYGLTDAQKLLAEMERTPANPKYGGVPEKYEMVTVDLAKLVDERKKWEDLYESVVRESGSDVVKGK